MAIKYGSFTPIFIFSCKGRKQALYLVSINKEAQKGIQCFLCVFLVLFMEGQWLEWVEILKRRASSDKMSSFVRVMSQLQKLSSTPFSFPLSGHEKRKENEDQKNKEHRNGIWKKKDFNLEEKKEAWRVSDEFLALLQFFFLLLFSLFIVWRTRSGKRKEKII